MRTILAICIILCLLNSCKKSDTPPVTSFTPTIKSISPASGGYNAIITIKGTNFSSTPANNKVTVNGVDATVQSATDTSITALVPERAGSGKVVVTNTNGTASGNDFTYTPNVFVTGFELNGTRYVAKYWKNGVETILNDSAVSNTILVSGNDVFAAGTKTINAGNNVALYWKNGVPTTLPTNNLVQGSVMSIFVAGNDIYATGTAIDNLTHKNIGVYWKNGVPTMLDNGTNSNAGYSIYPSANDVYVASSTWDTINTAKLWKNGTSIPLTNASNAPSIASSVFVAGNNVYVAGAQTNGTHFIAKYWKNNIEVTLTNGAYDAGASAIIVYGNDVYVAGSETTGTNSIAKYWKNGTAISLTDGTHNAVANSIQVIGNDVYVVGYETIGTKDAARYWKNGTKINLTDGTNQAQATSISVQ